MEDIMKRFLAKHRCFLNLNLALLALSFLFWAGCNSFRQELPNYGNIPAFQLTNQDEQSVSKEDYAGKVLAVNFIFTSCAGTCPMLTQRMKRVQDSLEQSAKSGNKLPVRIVSFSVDPETDTPQRLKEYTKNYGVNLKYWDFLTGPLDQVKETVVQGFKISMGKVPQGEKPTSGEIFEVVHGEKFVLVDSQGQIRGYYDSNPSGIKKFISDMKRLAKKASS